MRAETLLSQDVAQDQKDTHFGERHQQRQRMSEGASPSGGAHPASFQAPEQPQYTICPQYKIAGAGGL